jgi:8-oxo-dGTP diphosphatase
MGDATHAVIVKAYIWRDGKVLLMKRCEDDDIYPGHWDTPGGHLHIGESAVDGLKREVHEETSLRVKRARPVSTWAHETAIGISFITIDPGGDVQLSNEHVAFHWFSPEELNDIDAAENLKREVTWLVSKGWHR